MNFPGYRQLSIKVFLIYRLQFITAYRSRSIISDARDVKNVPRWNSSTNETSNLLSFPQQAQYFENCFDLIVSSTWKFNSRRLSIINNPSPLWNRIESSYRKNLPTFRFHVCETDIRILRAGLFSPRSSWKKKENRKSSHRRDNENLFFRKRCEQH